MDANEIEDVVPKDILSNFRLRRAKHALVHSSGHSVFLCRIALLEVSSTEIRKSVLVSRSIKYLVPVSVEDYIIKHRIY